MKKKHMSGIQLAYAQTDDVLKRTWLVPGLFGALLVVTAVFWTRLMGGMAQAYNRMLKLWMAHSGRISLEMPENGATETDILLFLSVAGLFLALLLYLMEKKSAGLAAVVFVLAAVAAGVLFPDYGVWPMLLLLCACVIAACITPERGKGAWKLAGIKAGACLLCILLVFGLMPNVEFTQFRQKAEDRMHMLRYEGKVAVLPEGDLERNLAADDRTVLEVEMEQPETLYLRGFVGEQFDGTRWSGLDKSYLSEQSDLLYWLHDSGFYPQTQLANAVHAVYGQVQENRVTVRNTGVCKKYAYAPHNLYQAASGAALDKMALETGTVLSNGEGAFVYTTAYDTANVALQLVDGLQQSDPQVFLSAEGSWRALVLDYAVQVSDDALGAQKEVLDALAKEYGGAEQLSLEQAATCALQYMDQYQAENAYQAATAAVLALRYYGIPARYVEGFVVTGEMATNTENPTVSLRANQASAWAEVYQDGLGWLPLDLAPGYQVLSGLIDENGVMNGNGAAVNPDNIPQGEELEEPNEQDETQQGEAPQSTPQTKMPENWLLKALWILLGLVLAVLFGIWLRRRRILQHRKEQFSDPDTGTGIAWLFYDAVCMLEHLGIARNGGSTDVVCKIAREQLGEAYADSCRSAALLNQKALFSSHALNEECRTAVAEFRQKTLALLREKKSWHKRLWLKWIRCVY